MKAVGIVLIAFGMLAAASTAATNAQAPARDPAQRLGNAIGGACCSFTLVGAGIALARSGEKVGPRRARRRGERLLRCTHCGALYPVGPTPAECDWCHNPWSGEEVTD